MKKKEYAKRKQKLEKSFFWCLADSSVEDIRNN